MKKLMILLLLSACASNPGKLSDAGEKVRTLPSSKNTGCKVVDKVIGESEKGSEELATNHARNLTADADGDAMYIDQVVPNGAMMRVFATAYKCR
ncbi:MAG: hypothetical protein HOE90_05505 [Bacteriovoracaceae bacterium]|nr:hypothetical protein [Bacteriovoracaceae bacterium]